MDLAWRNWIPLAVGVALLVLFVFLLYISLTTLTVRSGVRQERVSLRSIAAALESYFIDWSEYPHDLSALTRAPDLALEGGTLVERGPFLTEIPHSAFGGRLSPRYLRRSQHWFLWMPGPDGDFDISVSSEVREAFDMFWEAEDWRGGGISSPWLVERLYDPTNGVRSGGDVLWTQFQRPGPRDNQK